MQPMAMTPEIRNEKSYLGVKHKDLSLIMDFIYGGEVSVEEENIPSFIRSANVTSETLP